MSDDLKELVGEGKSAGKKDGKSEDKLDLGVELEILGRKIDKMEDDDDGLEDAIRMRRVLQRKQRIRHLQRELEEAKDGNDDGPFGMY